MLSPTLLNTPHKLFAPERAEIIAKTLNADPDDDWTYVVQHCPQGTGLSFIEIFDEDGEFVSNWL